MNNFKKPTMLMILDGFGISKETYGNAIAQAKTPNLDAIFSKYPNTTIGCSGLAVGLPDGQMGNSEVGHLNIGAGRIVYQELTRITKEIEEKTFFDNAALTKACDHVLKNHSSLHIFGLLSDGGVHSHISHLKAVVDLAAMKKINRVYIHCFLDGRDVPPRSAMEYIDDMENYIREKGVGKLASICGRYYAMDRDKRWDRIEKAYDAITLGMGRCANTAEDALAAAYAANENDEFVIPTTICSTSARPCTVKDNDAIIMFNFRPDRAREITRAFVADDFDGFERKKKVANLCYICMTQYDVEMPNVTVAYPPQSLKNTLGEYISGLGLTQLRIAETEKYAHVTFFFNGGVEAPNKNEDRILIQSPKVATYDLQPEMSAPLVKDAVIRAIDEEKYDLIILNFANADMVGHTGIMDAAVAAVETLDTCVEEIRQCVLAHGGQILMTADHGNADCMLDASGNVVTAHSLNDVPVVHISDAPCQLRSQGVLADLSPTLLELMNIPQPVEMTGKSLIQK